MELKFEEYSEQLLEMFTPFVNKMLLELQERRRFFYVSQEGTGVWRLLLNDDIENPEVVVISLDPCGKFLASFEFWQGLQLKLVATSKEYGTITEMVQYIEMFLQTALESFLDNNNLQKEKVPETAWLQNAL